MPNKKSIVILGPTASGKTEVAALLASDLNGEIISADSRQVYRDMNIGTGKDYEAYTINNSTIPYHLIDIVEAGENYHIAQYQKDVEEALHIIVQKNKTPIVCGGSGLYIETLLRKQDFTQVPIDEPLRQELESKSTEELLRIFNKNASIFNQFADTSSRKRLIRAIEINEQINQKGFQYEAKPPIIKDYVIFGLAISAEIRREKITKRLQVRLENGMIEEVESLLKKGVSAEKLIFYGLEYKFITQYLLNELTYDEMALKLQTAIHQFAKRQMTFFRSLEKKGFVIHWLDAQKPKNQIVEEIKSFL